MSKHRVVVLKIVADQLTVTEAAEQYGLSRRQVQRLLARYRAGGIEAVDPRSRRPKSNPRSTAADVVERVIELRYDLIGRGLDAGPVTIRWHLDHAATPENASSRSPTKQPSP